MAHYIIGIDLGTTNCALSYGELEGGDEASVKSFAIPQLIEAGTVEERPQLPSFHYQPAAHEVKDGALALPWEQGQSFAVGELARLRGAERPERLVSSAKSWLSSSEADRRGPILPWQSDEEDLEKVSPVETSRRFLAHLRAAWDASELGAEHPLAEQEVVLTVPASFDAVARELTAEAAKEAGLGEVVLLEEPLAAFYAWLSAKGDAWRDELRVGDRVLVCDIGGGTTDFSLIEAREEQGNLSLERIAVGDHILLGGDNMDLALAHLAASRIKDKKLDPWQSRGLWHSCREAKEKLLGAKEEAPESVKIRVLSKGRKLVGKTLKSELTREDMASIVLDGFFPRCKVDEHPQDGARSGLGELGLPYARDAAITRHLARFLSIHAGDGGAVAPAAVLVNGGVLKGTAAQERLCEVIASWADGQSPKLLAGTDLDLAVATGAAWYGLARNGQGIRVRGGTARSYYIGVERAMPAIPGFSPPISAHCIVPFGMEAGTGADVPGREYGLVVGEKAQFRVFSSTQRQDDAAGDIVEDDELEETAPLEATLEAEGLEPGTKVAVCLRSDVTEVGTLDLRFVAADGSRDWKLRFELRDEQG